jgi:hypothetical protein
MKSQVHCLYVRVRGFGTVRSSVAWVDQAAISRGLQSVCTYSRTPGISPLQAGRNTCPSNQRSGSVSSQANDNLRYRSTGGWSEIGRALASRCHVSSSSLRTIAVVRRVHGDLSDGEIENPMRPRPRGLHRAGGMCGGREEDRLVVRMGGKGGRGCRGSPWRRLLTICRG